VLLVILHRLLGGLELTRLWRDAGLIALACSVMGLGVWALLAFAGAWPPALLGLVGVAGGGALYAALTYALGVTDARQWVSLVARRMGPRA
jgi:hypothetical protein